MKKCKCNNAFPECFCQIKDQAMKLINENGKKTEYIPGGLLEVPAHSIQIPLADRKPDTVTSGRKLNAALKNERILGGGKAI